MPVREGAIDSDGVAIHYLDWGGEGVCWGAESHLRSRLTGACPGSAAECARGGVPGTTHFLPQEQPDELAGLVAVRSLLVGSKEPFDLAQGKRGVTS